MGCPKRNGCATLQYQRLRCMINVCRNRVLSELFNTVGLAAQPSLCLCGGHIMKEVITFFVMNWIKNFNTKNRQTHSVLP